MYIINTYTHKIDIGSYFQDIADMTFSGRTGLCLKCICRNVFFLALQADLFCNDFADKTRSVHLVISKITLFKISVISSHLYERFLHTSSLTVDNVSPCKSNSKKN